MEYTFRNSLKEKVVTLSLRPFSFLVQTADRERKIPYASVTGVQLIRKSGNLFETRIEIEDAPSVVVSNRFYLTSAEFEDRSVAYTTFIRVLHFHLKEKSGAVFSSGISVNSLVLRGLIVSFSAALIAFVAEFAGFSLLTASLLAVTLAVVVVATVLVVYQRRKVTKQYDPGDLPLHYLPYFPKLA